VWGQLGLRPSLPKDERSDDALPFEPGKLQINIKHAREDTEIEGKKCHRISSNVPFADITPTEGVPYVRLISVRFAMEIIRIQPSIKPTRPKKRRKLERTDTFKADSEDGEVPKLTKLPTELEDTYNGGEYGILWSEQRGDEDLSHTFDPSPKRRKRPSTLPNMGPGSGVPIMELLHNVENQTRPSTGSSPERVLTESCQSPVLELETLVDAAIRLAVCSSLPKPATGVKVKANTFTGGLTDVAPTLWSPGYLPVTSDIARVSLCFTLTSSGIRTEISLPPSHYSLAEQNSWRTSAVIVTARQDRTAHCPIISRCINTWLQISSQ
jgi:hypothetical protein